MACILDGTYTFENAGQYSDSSIPNVNYSNYSVTFNEQELVYLGGDAEEGYFFAVGGTIEDTIYPAVTVWPECGISAFASLANPYNGEATVSICEKESDSDACPDAPFSESAPEKYADYFNEDGVFVPKATSGVGDCDVTLATLTLKTSRGNEQYSGSNDFVSLITSGGETYFAYNSDSNTGDYVIPLYKGSTIINFSLFDQSTEIEVESGDIELMSHEEDYWSYKLMGDATLVLPYGGVN